MSDPHFARRAAEPTRTMIWRDRFREWIGGIVLLILVLLAMTPLFQWRLLQVRDAASGPLQTGTAVVMGKGVADLRGRAGGGWSISLQLNGQPVVANTYNLVLFNGLAEGDTVAYSVDKSGQVYVAEIAETAKQSAATSPVSR